LAQCIEIGSQQFWGVVQDVFSLFFLFSFFAYVKLKQDFLIVWQEIHQCSPYLHKGVGGSAETAPGWQGGDASVAAAGQC
jgi:hypothetical protein